MPYDKYNQRKYLILNMINHLGPISRTALIALTDYRPATVSAIVADLLETNLIVESGMLTVGHGRNRVLLEINKEHICAACVFFTATDVQCVLAQFDGKIVHEKKLSLSDQMSQKKLTEMILNYIEEIQDKFSPERRIVGVGLCMPTYDPTDYQKKDGLIFSERFFEELYEQELRPVLEKEYQLQVRIANNVVKAEAEHYCGVAKGVDNFGWVEIANGIGFSIYCNGKTMVGANGHAGEIGHTTIDFRDRSTLCYCGRRGCVESHTAWPALHGKIVEGLNNGVRSCLQESGKLPEELTCADIRDAMENGDQMCIQYVKEVAEHLGVAIANAANLLDPQMMVLHGPMLELGDCFLNALKESIRDHVIYFAKNLEIRVSSLKDNQLPLGAAAEIFSEYLHMEDHRWVYKMQPGETDAVEENQ